MLVLNRKVGERIIIGDMLIVVSVEQVKDGRVRIGIDAPKELPVHREEIYRLTKEGEQ